MDPRPFDPDHERGPTRARPGALAGLEALDSRPSWQPGPSPSYPAEPVAPVRSFVRIRIRRSGPFVALVLPAVLGLIAVVTLRGSTTTSRGVGGFVLALLAAPLLPAFGEPLRAGSSTVVTAAAASAVLWFVLGAVAARRATRSPEAGWGRFWSEYLWLCLCVWMGAGLAVVAANLVLGRVLL